MSDLVDLPKSRAEALERFEKYYFTGKPCKYGHIDKRLAKSSHCLSCLREKSREYYAKNPEKVKEINLKSMKKTGFCFKAHYQKNKEAIRKKRIEYYENNKEKVLKRNRDWRSRNRGYDSERKKKWRLTAEGKSTTAMRRMVHRLLNGGKKVSRTSDLLGYSSNDLLLHLEKQFAPWMTWENYGERWHIDHIIPIKYFLDNEVYDPAVINSLANLRPLCSKENVQKGCKVELLI